MKGWGACGCAAYDSSYTNSHAVGVPAVSEMAPGGVPGIAASVVANGGTIYKGLVAAVRRNADYDELKAEALEAVLNMFGRAKSKAAFRGRSKELAELMVGAGLTIWEDLRGVDLAWLETTVGVPHFEALAFFRFLDDSAQQEEGQVAAAALAAELEEELELELMLAPS